MTKDTKVALFGGSFDPPHCGHEAIVNGLCGLDFIDKVIVMPTFLNPFKSTFSAPPKLRLKWLKQIFKSNKKVEVSDFEVSKKCKVPTIESVEYLLKKYEKIYVAIGADNLEKLHTWHRYDELKKLVEFIFITRDDIRIPQGFLELKVDVKISSSSLREHIDSEFLPKCCSSEIEKYYKELHCKKD